MVGEAGQAHAAETTMSDKTTADKIDLIISECPLFGATALGRSRSDDQGGGVTKIAPVPRCAGFQRGQRWNVEAARRFRKTAAKRVRQHNQTGLKGPLSQQRRWYPLGELNPCFQVENLTS